MRIEAGRPWLVDRLGHHAGAVAQVAAARRSDESLLKISSYQHCSGTPSR